MRMLKNTLTKPQFNFLAPETEFWDGPLTREQINDKRYFFKADSMETDDIQELPRALREKYDSDFAMSALGGMISYLRSVKTF